jgi:prevent-host-death family protein
MKQATVTEAKNRLSALLAEVRAGETIVIVDRGVPVARLDPVADQRNDVDGRIARLQRTGAVHAGREEPPVRLILEEPPSLEPGASALDALLDERSEGR